jgi:hypothetical protein
MLTISATVAYCGRQKRETLTQGARTRKEKYRVLQKKLALSDDFMSTLAAQPERLRCQ